MRIRAIVGEGRRSANRWTNWLPYLLPPSRTSVGPDPTSTPRHATSRHVTPLMVCTLVDFTDRIHLTVSETPLGSTVDGKGARRGDLTDVRHVRAGHDDPDRPVVLTSDTQDRLPGERGAQLTAWFKVGRWARGGRSRCSRVGAQRLLSGSSLQFRLWRPNRRFNGRRRRKQPVCPITFRGRQARLGEFRRASAERRRTVAPARPAPVRLRRVRCGDLKQPS